MSARVARTLALVATFVGASVSAAVPAQAQKAQAPSPTAEDGFIIVNGKPIRAENESAFLQCEQLQKDPWYRALRATAGSGNAGASGFYSGTGMSPVPFVPTRAPRNPDYSKPPSVAVGSPVPKITLDPRYTRARLDSLTVRADASAIADGVDRATISTLFSPRPPAGAASRLVDCAEIYGPTRGIDGDPQQLPDGTWGAVGVDKTLPTAMVLFNQGRYAESRDWFLAASSDKGNGYGGVRSSLFLGKLYLEGLGAENDPVKAVRWLKDAATTRYDPITQTPFFDPDRPDRNTDTGEAAVILGNLYAGGFKGVPRDPEQSYRWYKRAYDVGHIPAAKTLGDLHRIGFGTPRSAKEAAEWYKRAAEFGLVSAQVALADLLDKGGAGLAADHKQALKWYQIAAQRENPEALYALARAYDFGAGVRADPEMALGLYKTAALAGSAPAKTALGTYFHEGRVVAHSEVTARDWFERAAAERDAEGMFNLAAMMANGQGGERDLTSAYMWLQQASVTGHDRAPVALAALERRMTPAERQAAQAATVK